MADTASGVRSARLEVRMTPDERQLIDRAAAATGTALTDFVLNSLCIAAHDALADRTEFALDEDGRRTWEELNQRPARELAAFRSLMSRTSPFVDG